jgi:hypothetical protein
VSTAHLVLAPLSLRLARRQRHAAAREARAAALRASAELAGAPRSLPCEDWPAAPSGAPAVRLGWRASFADTSGLVAALVARVPLAVDVEWLGRARLEAVRARFRADGELSRLGAEDDVALLSLWTAKEAVLKLAGVGLAGLARCVLVEREPHGLRLRFDGREHAVPVRTVGRHVIAWASARPAAVELVPLQEVA